MKATIYKENCTIKNNWIKIAETYDVYHPAMIVKAILDDYTEEGDKVTLKIEFDPEGKEE